ncbi:MAG: hypothetical protein AAB577_02100 [Patescibacteria group bacterium]
MDRGFLRVLAIVVTIAVAILVTLIIIHPDIYLGDKVFAGSLFALFVLLIKDILTGKFWDYEHKKEKPKDG